MRLTASSLTRSSEGGIASFGQDFTKALDQELDVVIDFVEITGLGTGENRGGTSLLGNQTLMRSTRPVARS